jgi:hypothetical protein
MRGARSSSLALGVRRATRSPFDGDGGRQNRCIRWIRTSCINDGCSRDDLRVERGTPFHTVHCAAVRGAGGHTDHHQGRANFKSHQQTLIRETRSTGVCHQDSMQDSSLAEHWASFDATG